MKISLCLRLLAALCVVSVALVSCAKENIPDPNPVPPTPPVPGSKAVNLQMDTYLKTHYLWNADYKTLKRDFTLEYDEFLKKTLLSMTTNIYDKKLNSEGRPQLYSYIERLPLARSLGSTRGVTHNLPREKETGFGIARMVLVEYSNTNPVEYGFEVSAVYPGSPADKAGVKRGFAIQKVDAKSITESNYVSLYYTLLAPENKPSVALTGEGEGSPVKTLTAAEYELNPVLHSEVIDFGGRKTGYLVYLSFDAGFDNELLAAIQKLKTAGVTDLVLDLRLNGGGHVISSKMLSSCIAGAACKDKVFQYYRYNDDRMATPDQTGDETGMRYDTSKKRFYENFTYGNYFGVNLQGYALAMTRLYVLVSGNTASASEAVIGALKGIDIPVTLIGEKTSGKNVGMEPRELADNKYRYVFYPITFQGYNAKDESVDHLGLQPNDEVDDWAPGYVDFGNTSDPMLAKALTHITGQQPQASGKTRAAANLLRTTVSTPEPQSRVHGMILLPPADEGQQ